MSSPSGTDTLTVGLTVNGSQRTVPCDPWISLAALLRGELGLTGTTLGCEQGMCGSCTVLMDGVPVRSCLVSRRSGGRFDDWRPSSRWP